MAESQHKQATDILMKAFAEPVETQEQETAEPTEEQETESSSSETLQTQETETQEAEASEEDISTLNHLAETLDIPIEDMYALNFNLQNGEQVSLGSLKDFYDQNREIEQARADLENERSRLEAEKAEGPPPVHAELVQALANKTAIEREWQDLETSGLRQSNPGEYAAKATELQNKYQGAIAQLGNVQQEVERNQMERLRNSQQELHKLVPDLKDDAKREGIAKRVEGMFKHYHVGTQYIGMIEDPNAMKMLIELSHLFEQKGDYKKKRIDTAPKVLKPQSVQNSQAGKAAALKRLTEKARQSGQRRDQINAVSALLQK